MKRLLTLAFLVLMVLMLLSLAACSAKGSGTPFLLFGTQMALDMPEDWSFFYQPKRAQWAFFSPDVDVEFLVSPLELQEGETVNDLFMGLEKQYTEGDEGVKNLEMLYLRGCSSLMYVDEAGKNCAYIMRSSTEGYHITCTGLGDDGQFFRERLNSIRWIAENSPSPYVRKVEQYMGYEFELELVGLKAYIPMEFSFEEYREEYQYYVFKNGDGTKKLVVSCGYTGGHLSPNHTAEFIWDSSSNSSTMHLTAESSLHGRMYAFWQDRSTGKLIETYVLGNHGFTVNCYGDLPVEQMRYFMDRLEDIEVTGEIKPYYYDDSSEDEDDEPSYHYEDDECGVCSGTGICVGCHGRRRTRIPGYGGVGTAKYVDCAACGGTGRCRTCDGTGRD